MILPLNVVIALILTTTCSVCLAQDQPPQTAAETAEKAHNEAQVMLAAAEARFLKAVESITDKVKQDDTIKLYTVRKHLWDRLIDADSRLSIAISPSPNTSTSASLLQLWTAVRHMEVQINLLNDEAEWIRVNWSNRN